MPTSKTQTVTITETATLLRLKINPWETRSGFCPQCAADVIWIELPIVIEPSGVSTNGAIHRYGDEICLQSLIGGIGE